MNAEEEKAKRIIDKHESDLQNISEEIIKGASEGFKEGITDGIKKGLQSGFWDYLEIGFMNIGPDYIKDILKFDDTVKENFKDRIKREVKPTLIRSAKDCLKTICQKIFAGIKKGDVKLSEGQTVHIINLIKTSEREAINKAVEKLPTNPLFSEVVAGMKEVWEDCLLEAFKGYEKK